MFNVMLKFHRPGKIVLVIVLMLISDHLFSQTITASLQKAYQQFQSDSQLRHAISSLYVVNAKTGEVVFDMNSQVGLAGASTQKIITAATAFELLGKDYRYKTELGYNGKIKMGVLTGPLLIRGSGDPTLGSWRWNETKDSFLLRKWVMEIKKAGIHKVLGLSAIKSSFSYQAIPNGWIWEDIGNYYGAGAYAVNWKENQYDLYLTSENKLGGTVSVAAKSGGLTPEYVNQLKAADKNSGDNAYIYYDDLLNGTIPLGQKNFKISGATKDPSLYLLNDLSLALKDASIKTNYSPKPEKFSKQAADTQETIVYTHYSPSLDSIVYWFLKKSINLYGEALVKTFAYEKQGYGSTDSGVAIVKNFWKDKGLDEDELNIYDGSGLSPLNRLTTHAQVEVLKYAKTRDWFSYFYNALPEFNNMKMKSGTINDVKGFCGYQVSKDGTEYIFSFLVNNYNGRSSALVNKMYKVLDELK
jgi:D-alanyl-D-alanine carboxypeptidase/D-alanyl-D-alanine-endopeptidase (penicillin-binding protein 4)